VTLIIAAWLLEPFNSSMKWLATAIDRNAAGLLATATPYGMVRGSFSQSQRQ